MEGKSLSQVILPAEIAEAAIFERGGGEVAVFAKHSGGKRTSKSQ